MEKIDLKRALKGLGAANLSKFAGESHLQTLLEIYKHRVTERQLVEILLSRYGTTILAQKEIRISLLKCLPQNAISYILYGSENETLSSEDLEKLLKTKFKRLSPISKRLVEVFNLPESFLPPERAAAESDALLVPELPLYGFQRQVKNSLLKKLFQGEKRVLLHLPTGSGKTRTTMEALVDFWRIEEKAEKFILWLTDSEELCLQAEDCFKKLWQARGDRSLKLYRLWGGNSEEDIVQSGGIIIASLQKLHKMRTSESNTKFKFINELTKNATLIVIDEAHKTVAPTYKSTIEFLCDIKETQIIGLTATPGRAVQKEIPGLVEFYGENKISILNKKGLPIKNPIEYLQRKGFLSQLERRVVATEINIDLKPEEIRSICDLFEIPQRVIFELSINAQRNTLIINELAKLAAQNKQIIVFGCSVEHSHLINDLLVLRGLKARCVDAKTGEQERLRFVNEFKSYQTQILVNYGIFTTGFDAPNTDAVMITRPTSSLVLYSQMIGRGLRGPKMGGTGSCLLLDIVDNIEGFPGETKAFNYFDQYWGKS